MTGDPAPRRPRDERGSGTMLMVGVLVVLLALGWAATVIAGYLVAAHRAKSAADLAALSGATTALNGGDGCSVARRVAARQGATTQCAQVGDAIDFVITVRATVTVPTPVPGLPGQVTATGHAGPTSMGGGS